jgi:hypothetical protein
LRLFAAIHLYSILLSYQQKTQKSEGRGTGKYVKTKSKPNEPPTAEPARRMGRYGFCSFYAAAYEL